ncbi:MAG: S1C family serine protease [Myxococcaceae bacterium]
MPAPLSLVLAALVAQAEPAPSPGPNTEKVFEAFKDRVAQIRILEATSSTKSAIGSAFFVDGEGLLLTNYHVVSLMVHHPERYTAELVREGLPPSPVTLLDVDVVNDLALVKAADRPLAFFALGAIKVDQGTRLYSLGNPRDLGISIVEGTYNGPVLESLYERLHFTGSINRGMSGGPTITADGTVVGVNVATGGDQLGFLVPISHALLLLERARAGGQASTTHLLRARDQLVENQERLTASLLAASLPKVELGERSAPGRWLGALKCWGDSGTDEKKPYQITDYYCFSDDEVYVSDAQRTGFLKYRHQHARSSELGALRFSSLMQSMFADNLEYDEIAASAKDVGAYQCRTRFVTHRGTHLRVMLCLRAYKKLPGLYDLVLRAATLEASDEGVVTTLVLAGFSSQNALALARRYLEAVQWKD